QSETLASGASTTVTFNVDTTGLAADTYTHGVSTANDTATAQITLNEPATPTADFQVSNLQAPAEATVNDTITVSADVQNDGGAEGTQSVEFGVDTDGDGSLETLASQSETLASGASTTVTFNVDTTGLAADTYTHGVSTANDTATAQITLNPETVQNGTVAGTVTDDSGNALSGATVTAGSVTTTTAADGSYSLSIAPGDYQVTANADGFQSVSKSATVTESTTTTVDFSLTPEDGTITGTVTDTMGNNLGGATVTADGQSTTTAADGSYTLTVAPGTYTVEATAQDYNSASAQVSVGPGETVTQDFSLEMVDTGPKNFTAYVRGEESYLQTGTPNNDRPILYSTCRDGQPDPAEQGPDFLPTDDCIQIDGTIYPSNNTWRGSVDFPPARDIINETQSDTIGNVYFRANLTTAGQAGGTFNLDNNRTSLETTIDIGITVWTIGTIFDVSSPAQNPYDQVTSDSANRLSDPGCTLPSVSINVSTEKSYQTGSAFPATSTVTGERINNDGVAKLVSDDFNVDTATGCGSVFGVNINDQVNAEQGLPAGPGDNEAAYLTEFNIETGS
uniref:carboxypeptidase regulatory-like domain-containing protein n=1 Tax=Halorientalis sp. TaxID=1931229 RepID=UPI002610200A